MREVLGADGLMYQDLDDMIALGKAMNSSIEAFDASCFDGKYVTGGHYCRVAVGVGRRTCLARFFMASFAVLDKTGSSQLTKEMLST